MVTLLEMTNLRARNNGRKKKEEERRKNKRALLLLLLLSLELEQQVEKMLIFIRLQIDLLELDQLSNCPLDAIKRWSE